jgi:nitrite reductase (NADH) small subunit
MPVVKFDPIASNFLIHGDQRFFLMPSNNQTFLVGDRCPHRGGPLHLGQVDCQNKTIICPWHQFAVSTHRLQKSALPLVWRKNIAIAVLPELKLQSIT